MYSKEFKGLLEKSVDDGQYVGLGNPNSKILFIGKEAGIENHNKREMESFSDNAKIWLGNSDLYSKPFCPERDSSLRNYRHTWQKYQKLHDFIFERESPESYCINFVENIFTTELSNLPYPNTNGAKQQNKFREELQKRKNGFFENKYFKDQFSIVVILALDGHYISNYGEGETREIDNIFEVEFFKQVECSSSKDKFWLHHAKDKNKPRLLIHSRQLTNGASIELLETIAEEIKTFSKKQSIDLMPFNSY
jgi:hypothetical protein